MYHKVIDNYTHKLVGYVFQKDNGYWYAIDKKFRKAKRLNRHFGYLPEYHSKLGAARRLTSWPYMRQEKNLSILLKLNLAVACG